jgi:hypothetical protein
MIMLAVASFINALLITTVTVQGASLTYLLMTIQLFACSISSPDTQALSISSH